MSSQQPGREHVDVLAGVGGEVAAVADHDGVALEPADQLAVDPGGLDRVGVEGEQRVVRGAAARLAARGPSSIHASWATWSWYSARRSATAPSIADDGLVGPGLRRRCSRARRRCARPWRRRSGRSRAGSRARVPTTTTRSASVLSRPRVRVKASGWSAGQAAPPQAVEVARQLQPLGGRAATTPTRPSQYTSLPRMTAGRSAAAIMAATRSTASRSGSGPRDLHGVGQLGLGRAEDVEREVEEHRPAVRRHGGQGGLVHLLGGQLRAEHRAGRLGDRGDDRHVVELLQRPGTPPALRARARRAPRAASR